MSIYYNAELNELFIPSGMTSDYFYLLDFEVTWHYIGEL